MGEQDPSKIYYQTTDLAAGHDAALASPIPTSSAALVVQPAPAPPVAKRGNPAWVRGGASPNPTGRPRGAAGLAAYVAQQTSGGVELVDALLKIVRNDYGGTRDRLNAIHELLDRLVGKSIATTDMTVVAASASDLGPEFDGLSPAQQVQALRALRQRALESGSGS